jgi:DNA-directed RNA polymerase specialized sigma24 family protein
MCPARSVAQDMDVEREQALAELPPVYAIALRLDEEGVARDVIARGVGVEPQAVEPLLVLARAKLAELMHERARFTYCGTDDGPGRADDRRHHGP